MNRPCPTRVAAAAALEVPVTLPYLRRLLAYVETLVHEVGHMFEDVQSDGFEIDTGRALYGNAPFSHDYLRERPVEDFAECFRQFFTEPGRLRRLAPAKYEDMRARLAR